MRFITVTCFLAVSFSGSVSAQQEPIVHSLALRQAGPLTAACNATCAKFDEAMANCKTPHCGCTVPFLQAQGECLLCQTSTPQDDMGIHVLLDAEMNRCHSEGKKVAFQLDLPPAAAAVVQKFDRDSASFRRIQTAYLALQIAGGHTGLVIILGFAIFSQNVCRDPTFFNFCITWIFYSVVFSIPLYRGVDGNNLANTLGEVSPNLCLLQAVLTAGAQVMTACSTLSLTIQFWIGIRAAIYADAANGTKQPRWTTCGLLMAPYILFLAFTLSCTFVGTGFTAFDGNSLERVIPYNFYCGVLTPNPLFQAVYSATLTLLIVTMIFDGKAHKIGDLDNQPTILYKHWRAFRHSGFRTKSVVSFSVLLRVLLFSLYRVAVAVAYGSLINKPPALLSTLKDNILAGDLSIPIWVDFLQAAIPLVGFIILGSNTAMINSFVFWRRFQPNNASSVQSINTTSHNAMDNICYDHVTLEGDAKFVSVTMATNPA